MKEQILRRAAKLRALMKKDGVDAFVVIVDENANWESLYYLSGFRGTSGAFVLYQDDTELVLDGRYSKQGGEQSPYPVAEQKDSLMADVRQSLDSHGAKTICCEASKTFHSNWQQLAEYQGEWRDGTEYMRSLRRTKDREELGFMRRAAEVAAEAFLDTLNHVKTGMTELEYQALLNYKITSLGGGTGFEMVVASGVRSAMPHGRATDKRMAAGEWVTVDFGVVWNGYFCDITRNFSIGEPDSLAAVYHENLIEAHAAGARMLRAGAEGAAAHEAARKVLESAGVAEYFTHGLGHGLGLEIHEAPFLSAKKNDILAAGDVVTVEPGIYIGGWGGLRLEDDYVITENSAERLTDKLKQCFYRI